MGFVVPTPLHGVLCCFPTPQNGARDPVQVWHCVCVLIELQLMYCVDTQVAVLHELQTMPLVLDGVS